jgi:hypothetical protein
MDTLCKRLNGARWIDDDENDDAAIFQGRAQAGCGIAVGTKRWAADHAGNGVEYPVHPPMLRNWRGTMNGVAPTAAGAAGSPAAAGAEQFEIGPLPAAASLLKFVVSIRTIVRSMAVQRVHAARPKGSKLASIVSLG